MGALVAGVVQFLSSLIHVAGVGKMAETQTIIDAIRDEVMLHMMDKPLSTLTVRMMKDAIMAGWIVGRPQILITDGDEYGSIDVQLSEPNLDEVRQAVRKSLGVAPSYR